MLKLNYSSGDAGEPMKSVHLFCRYLPQKIQALITPSDHHSSARYVVKRVIKRNKTGHCGVMFIVVVCPSYKIGPISLSAVGGAGQVLFLFLLSLV